MKSIIFEKRFYDIEDGVCGLFLDTESKKHLTLSGNIPDCFDLPGLSMMAEIQKDKILSYAPISSRRNETILKKFDISMQDFLKKCEIHQKTGLLWREMKDIRNPYRVYSFDEADRIFKKTAVYDEVSLEDRMQDRVRILEILRLVHEMGRQNRYLKMTVQEYMHLFRVVENKGCFPSLSNDFVIFTLLIDDFYRFDGKMLIDREAEEAEEYVFSKVKNQKKHPVVSIKNIEKYLGKHKGEYTDEQEEAIKSLVDSSVLALTGGAGVGKTYTINGIIGAFVSVFDIENVLLVAPTGKAARRMKELCYLTKKTEKGEIKQHIEAYTIDSALRRSVQSDYICFNESNPLSQQLIICDESSMVDIFLMKDLMSAISPTAKLILVGDVNQLYPVGCGEPYHDLINARLSKVVRLTKNFRQRNGSGYGIYENSMRVLNNQGFTINQGTSIKRIKEEDIFQYVKKNTQMITPYNDLNNRINQYITKENLIGSAKYYVGEKVIFLKNNKTIWRNGDVGFVRHIGKGEIDVDLYGHLVQVTAKDFMNVAPAYALTVHKCQGSEYEKVILFLPEKKSNFITKRLLYTAITRAKSHIQIYIYSEKEKEDKTA